MNKYAICLFGYNGLTSKFNKDNILHSENFINYSYQSLEEKILKYNQCDIFIHTWESPIVLRFIDVFQPQAYLVETQPNFINQYCPVELTLNDRLKQAIYAKHHSMLKAVQLCRDNELQHNILYDKIILARPDLYYDVNIKLDQLNPNEVYISNIIKHFTVHNKNLELQKRILPKEQKKHPNIKFNRVITGTKKHQNFHDNLFISNSKNIFDISQLYNYLVYYLQNEDAKGNANFIGMHELTYHHVKYLNLLDKVNIFFNMNEDVGLIRDYFYE